MFTGSYLNWKDPTFSQTNRDRLLRVRSGKKGKKKAGSLNVSETNHLMNEVASLKTTVTVAQARNSLGPLEGDQDRTKTPKNTVTQFGVRNIKATND